LKFNPFKGLKGVKSGRRGKNENHFDFGWIFFF